MDVEKLINEVASQIPLAGEQELQVIEKRLTLLYKIRDLENAQNVGTF